MKTAMFTSAFRSATLLAFGLLGAFSTQAQNPVTFSVDMTSQPSATDVFVRGSFNGWGDPDPYLYAHRLTNDGFGTYTGTVDIADSPGTVESCKFYYDPGAIYENGANRQFVLAGGAQTLPLTAWNDKYPIPTNNITFQVDMTPQVLTSAFTNGVSEVRVSGGFTGWGGGDLLTNNPALMGSASNIHSVVLSITGFPGSTSPPYKFRANGGWESPPSFPPPDHNRTFTIAGGDQVLPLAFYNDASICDLVQQATAVTFTVRIPTGTPYGQGGDTNAPPNGTFDPPTDKVYINGDFQGWKPSGPDYGDWRDPIDVDPNPFTVTPEGLALELTNTPATDKYTVTLMIPAGKTLATTYKYTINGYDNEAGMNVNHVRYIRTPSGVAYTMPEDQWSTNAGPPVVEQSFGNLAISSPSGGNFPITWSGRQCVTLQTKTTLAGAWVDIPATDGTSATNFPNTGGARFFRLRKAP